MFKFFPHMIVLVLLLMTGVSAGAQGDDASPRLAYVAYFDGGFRIYDVSDPSSPVDIGGYNTPRLQALDIKVRDNYAYVADGYGGLQIYDISNTAKIELTKSFKRPCDARAVSLMDNCALVAANNSIQIFNISDPANAYWITTYEIDVEYDQHIEGVDGYAYVACGVNGLKILDVSDPGDTHIVGEIKAHGMDRGIEAVGDLVYVAEGSAGLQIIDVSDKSNPERIGAGIRTGDAAWSVYVDGNTAYVADRNDGLHIIDISAPDQLSEIGFYKIHRGKASVVEVSGGYAFVAAVNGDLQVIDVSDPANPVLVSWIETRGTARSVVVTS